MPGKPHHLCSSAELVRSRIRELRVERRLTQEQLCDLAGISRDAVSRIENGSRTPSLDTLERLISALEVSWNDVLRHVPVERGARSPYVVRIAALLEPQPEEKQRIAEALVRAYLRAAREPAGAADERRLADRAAEAPAPYTSPGRRPRRGGDRRKR